MKSYEKTNSTIIDLKKHRGLIIVLVVVIGLGAIFVNYDDKISEQLTQDRIKAEKRLSKARDEAKAKDTIPLIRLVPAKKIDGL